MNYSGILYTEKISRIYLQKVCSVACRITQELLQYGLTSFWKIWKRHFFQDIQNSFQWPTGIGLEPHQKIFRKKIPTITVARAVQNLGRNGPMRAGWLNNGKNIFIKLAQTCDEQMVKNSERYLKPLLSNSKLTKFHWSR